MDIDDEDVSLLEYSINPAMLWAVRTGEDEISLYVNEEDQPLRFSQYAVDLILKALTPFGTS